MGDSQKFSIPDCSICMDSLLAEMSVIRLCGHVFHTHCIMQSLEHKKECPNCRQRVQKNDSSQLIALQSFEIQHENEQEAEMRKLLDNLGADQAQQFNVMMQEHSKMVKENIRIKKVNEEYIKKQEKLEKDSNFNKEIMKKQKHKLMKQENDITALTMENESLKEGKEQVERCIENLNGQNDKLEDELEQFKELKSLKHAFDKGQYRQHIEQIKQNPQVTQEKLIRTLNETIFMQHGEIKALNEDFAEAVKKMQKYKSQVSILSENNAKYEDKIQICKERNIKISEKYEDLKKQFKELERERQNQSTAKPSSRKQNLIIRDDDEDQDEEKETETEKVQEENQIQQVQEKKSLFGGSNSFLKNSLNLSSLQQSKSIAKSNGLGLTNFSLLSSTGGMNSSVGNSSSAILNSEHSIGNLSNSSQQQQQQQQQGQQLLNNSINNLGGFLNKKRNVQESGGIRQLIKSKTGQPVNHIFNKKQNSLTNFFFKK